jgi:hypothetical protein
MFKQWFGGFLTGAALCLSICSLLYSMEAAQHTKALFETARRQQYPAVSVPVPHDVVLVDCDEDGRWIVQNDWGMKP